MVTTLTKHLIVLAAHLSLITLAGYKFLLELCKFDLLVLEDHILLQVFLLQSVVPNNEASVLLCAQLRVSPVAQLLLVLVLTKLGDGVLHLLKTLIELLDLVSVTLFALLTISEIAHDIVLVEFHQASQILALVLCVDNLLHVLLEFDDDGFLFLSALLLHRNFKVDLIDLTLHSAQALCMILQLRTLILEVLLKLQ